MRLVPSVRWLLFCLLCSLDQSPITLPSGQGCEIVFVFVECAVLITCDSLATKLWPRNRFSITLGCNVVSTPNTLVGYATLSVSQPDIYWISALKLR